MKHSFITASVIKTPGQCGLQRFTSKTQEICVRIFCALILKLRKPGITSCPKPKNKLCGYKHTRYKGQALAHGEDKYLQDSSTEPEELLPKSP